MWIWWQGRLRVVPPHLHGRVISIVQGGQGPGVAFRNMVIWMVEEKDGGMVSRIGGCRS